LKVSLSLIRTDTPVADSKGSSFNPERFDPARINRRLHQLSWSRRRREVLLRLRKNGSI